MSVFVAHCIVHLYREVFQVINVTSFDTLVQVQTSLLKLFSHRTVSGLEEWEVNINSICEAVIG